MSTSSARAGFVLLALFSASCNEVLGLDDVQAPMADGSAPRAGDGGGGSGGAGGGRSGSSCGYELLRNGNFDMGATGWFTAPENEVVIRAEDDPEVSAQTVAPHSPRYLVRFGGPSRFLVTWIDQSLDLPSDALEVTVAGSLLIRTDEVPDDDYDSALFELTRETATTTTSIFRSFPRWTNRTAAPTWTPFSVPVNVASFAGMQATFRLAAELDQEVASYFFFDSVSLVVTACRQ